jgi:peptidoglycan/xylan/chitin deacetylase (PgdA/CDA1 family)
MLVLALAVAVTVRVVDWGAGRSHHAPTAAAATRSKRHHRAHEAAAHHHHRTAPARPLHPSSVAVPILMYHVIAAPPPGAPFPGLYVAPAEFAAQMRALAHAGYHAVTLDQVRSFWQGRAKPPRRPIVLSFDNGYRTQYTVALPTLRRYGWVGDENIQLTGLPPALGGLGPPEVRALVAAGWELDTQGQSHADLVTQDAAGLHYQIAVARSELRRRYHVPVNWFCYPSGDYDSTVIAAVRAAGFVGATTVVPGWARPGEDPYRLPRLRVLGGTTPAALLGQLAQAQAQTAVPSSYTVG